jgi:acyl-coenzyme A synthetase/AMP-(fatty) acid ligase
VNELAELVSGARAARGETPTITDGAVALDDRALLASAALASKEILRLADRASCLVAVTLPLGADPIVLLTAAILGGFSVCFLDPAAPEIRRHSILNHVRPDVIVDSAGMRKTESVANPQLEGRPPGYVAMSSGSMGGGPKGVLSPWTSVAAFVPHGAVALELDSSAAFAEASHLSFDMAMTNILLALGSGARIHMSSSLSDRLRPLRFVGRVGATHIRVAPRFVDLALAERRGPSPSPLRVWGSGGDRLYASQVRRIFELGISTVVNTYGTSESVGFASTARFAAQGELSTLHGSVTIGNGAVGPWRAELHDIDEQSMIAVRTPYLPGGYFFGESSDDYPSWKSTDVIVTGDIGELDGANLFCLGRSGRRIKRSGTFIDLDEIDSAVRSQSNVSSFTVLTADGELVSLVEAADDRLSEILSILPTTLRPDMVPNRLLSVRQLPRLDNGKVDQGGARDLADQYRKP